MSGPAGPVSKPPEAKAPVANAPEVKTPTVKRAAMNQPAPQSAPKAPIMRQAASAGAKSQTSSLPVSSPSDPAEREAVGIASNVMRASLPGAANGGELAPMRPKESLVPPVSRQTEVEGGAGEGLSVDAKTVQDLGAGQPLLPETRTFFEQRFGQDLSHVRIHVGGQADRAAKAIEARAFTVGADIAFAQGQYDPVSPAGQELIAHELVHVLQGGQGASRMVMRAGPGLTGAGETDAITLDVPLGLPRNKSRHFPAYEKWAKTDHLIRPESSMTKGDTEQKKKWKQSLNFTDADIRRVGGLKADADPGSVKLHVEYGGKEISTLSELAGETGLADFLEVPTWNKKGEAVSGQKESYHVDHVIETQLGGKDELNNYELLRGSNNMSSGVTFRNAIKKATEDFLEKKSKDTSVSKAFKKAYPAGPLVKKSAKKLLSDKQTSYKTIALGNDGASAHTKESTGEFWTRAEIQELKHISLLLLPADLSSDGTDKSLALYSPTAELRMGKFEHSKATVGELKFEVTGANQSLIHGLKLSNGTLTYGNDLALTSGSLTATWDLDPNIFAQDSITKSAFPVPLEAVKGKQHAAKFNWSSEELDAKVNAFSPIKMTDIVVSHSRLDGSAIIISDLPFLGKTPIPARLDGRGLRLSHSVDIKTLLEKQKLPGLTINEANLVLFIDEQGAGAEGDVSFKMKGLGEGSFFVAMTDKGRFELLGDFLFDTNLFDQALVNLAYTDKGFSVTGKIAITDDKKIKGVKSASADVIYDEAKGILVSGTVTPSIPGIKSATLSYATTPDGQQVIQGEATLDKIPGLKQSTIGILVTQKGEAWTLGVSGDVESDVPGISTRLKVSYDDGAFLIGGQAHYEKGPFSGDIQLGATNMAVDKDGVPSKGKGGKNLSAFGSGTLTAKLTDTLFGTVGVKIQPDGKMLISGGLTLADPTVLFKQYPDPAWQKELLKFPTLNIPIFGGGIGSFTVGIAATIGGGVVATAYVGPGLLRGAKIGIEDFDPTNFGSLHVKGSAHFEIPAYAGIKLSVDAGITGGLGVISATGGINLAAEAGIRASAGADANIDWTPSKGIDLQTSLNASIEPKMKFSVGGFAKVDTPFGWTLYRKDWNFASFEYGPALKMGLNMPIGYNSLRGLDLDFNKVNFQLPSLDPKSLATGILKDKGKEKKEAP